MRWQLELFGTAAPAFDAGFQTLRREELASGAWIDYAPGWVAGHEVLFDRLTTSLEWRSESRPMYDRVVAVPRLLASVPAVDVIADMQRALGKRYGEDFARTTAALYRDGSDSVAFHGDTTARDLEQAVVATVSLGEPRKFLLKPAAGGGSITYRLGRGDLIVMGGTCQRTWRHAIPKAVSAGPRIALMFRPVWLPP
ncbi:MAG TPA: alpha-ketoglutarate-dependent dioxygenase AlkB [Kofleriaceae bacterium]